MTILYSNDFDNATSLNFTKSSSPTNPSISSDFAYGGSGTSLKCVIPAMVNGLPVTSDPNHYRAEVNSFDIHGSDEYMTPGQVYRWGFAIFIPTATNPSSYGEIIWQLHNHPVGNKSDGTPYTYTNPTRHINIRNNGFYWRENKVHDLVKNQWVRIVIELRCATDSTGYVKLFINDALVHNETGNNMVSPAYNGTAGYRPYIKMGLYAWVRKNPDNGAYPGDSTGELVAYIDKLKIGDAASTYADVDPAGGADPGGAVTRTYIENFPLNAGFNNGSSAFAAANLDGTAVPSTIPGWTAGSTLFGSTPTLNKNGGTDTERWAAITNDTTLDSGNVLEVGIAETNASQGKGRVQFGASFSSKKVLKFRYKLWLHPDVGLLRSFQDYDWFAISSVFADNTWDSDYPFVISADICKNSSVLANELVMRLRARPYSNTTYSPQSPTWEAFSTQAVPIGKWMLVEHEIIAGGSGTGRYKIYITPEGGSRTLYLDVTNYTRHPSKPTDTITAFTPIKWYTGTAQINHVKNLGGKLIAQFDDLQLLAADTDIAWPTSDGTTITLKGSGGTPPVTGGTGITAINNGTNEIAASTAVNTFIGSGLGAGVAARIKDADTTEDVEVIVWPDGSQGVFNTGALTDIATPATIEIDHAEPDYQSYAPRTWGDNYTASLRADYATAYGPFNAGEVISSEGASWKRYVQDTGLTADAGDVIDAVFWYEQGTATTALFVIGDNSDTHRLQFQGTVGSLSPNDSDITNGTYSITEGASAIYPNLRYIKVSFEVAAGLTAEPIYFGFGAFSSAANVNHRAFGIEVWKNRTLTTSTKQVEIPALLPALNPAPTISSVTNLTSGQTVTVTGTGLRSVVSAKISDSTDPEYPGTEAEIDDWVPNVAGTSATFTAPYGIAASGNTLVLTWAPIQVRTSDWSPGSGSAIIVNPVSGGSEIVSGGLAWGRATVNGVVAQVGHTIKTGVPYIVGSSSDVSVSVRHSDTGLQAVVSGTPGSLRLSRSDLGSGHVFTETVVGNQRLIELIFVCNQSGQLTVGVGPDSEIDGASVIAAEAMQWSTAGLGTVTSAVTVASTTTKKVKFDVTNGRLKRGGSYFTGTADHLKIYDVNPLLTTATELAHAENVSITSGELTVIESDLTSGSIDALLAGTNYWFFIFDEDKDPFAFGEIQITVE